MAEAQPAATGWAVATHLCALSWVANVPGVLPTLAVWALRRKHAGDHPHAAAALRFQAAVAVAAALVWLAFLAVGGLTGIVWVVPEILLAPYVLVAISIVPSLRAAGAASRGLMARYPVTGAATAPP